MAAANRGYYNLTQIMKSWEISKSIKLKIYRIIRPIVTYGCEGGMDYVRTHGGRLQSMVTKDLKEGILPEKGHKWIENCTNKELHEVQNCLLGRTAV
jgi:hypothetical protein